MLLLCWGISWWQLYERVGCVINVCQWSTGTYARVAWPGLQPDLKGQHMLWAITAQNSQHFPTCNYIPQHRLGKEPEGTTPAWRSQAGGWHFSSMLPHAGEEGTEPSWDFACPWLQAVLSHIPGLFGCCRGRCCPPSQPFLPAVSSTEPQSLQTCPAPVITCPGKSNCPREVVLCWLIKHSHVFK